MFKYFLVGCLILSLIGSTLLLGYLLSPPPTEQIGGVHTIQIARQIGQDVVAHFAPPGHKARAV